MAARQGHPMKNPPFQRRGRASVTKHPRAEYDDGAALARPSGRRESPIRFFSDMT